MMSETIDYVGESDETPYPVTSPENLPSKPVKPPPELREQMRQMAKTNLYYLCKVVLGYDKMVPHVHMPMCEFADTVKARRRLKLMPRTHFKTTVWTIGLTIKDIINDCNVTVLLIADTGTNASRFMREIQQHFEMNELFRWLFPEVIPESFTKATWSQTEMIVPRTKVRREPTVDAIGAGGGVESRHYDIIRPDDLVTEKCIRSAVEMKGLNQWAGGLESLLNSEIDGLIDFTGSRKQLGDLYAVQEKRYGDGFEKQEIGPHATQIGDLAIFWRRDIEDEKPIFPEQNSLGFLMRMKKWDPQRYHAQYANSPKGSGLNTYNEKDLRFWRWAPDGRTIICAFEGELFLKMSPWAGERIIVYDPAQAKNEGNSQNAILVILKGYPLPYRIVLEAHVGHYPTDEAVQLLFDLDKKWKPSLISVEYRGFQGAIKNWVHEKAEREGLNVPPMMLWPPKGSPKAQWAKEQHLFAVQPLVRTNLVWLHKTQIGLVEQFESHPNVQWDDGLDAFSQTLDYWPAMMSDAEYMESVQTERDYIEKHIGVIPLFQDPEKKAFDEMAWLGQLNATGYRQHIGGRRGS